MLDNKIQYLNGENHRIDHQLRTQGLKYDKIEDYENKFALISLEVERLNGNLKLKVQQTAELDQQLANIKKQNTRLKEQASEQLFRFNQMREELSGKIKDKEQECVHFKQQFGNLKYSEIKV